MRYIYAISFLALSFPHAALSADSSNSELDRVKEALVEAAIEKGVSVVSNAYIDGNGELIESSFYRSGATLRGIRMPQYFLNEEPYDAQLLFSDTALNSNLSCQELSPHKYGKAISIDTTSVILDDLSDKQFATIISQLRSEIDMSATSAIVENENYYIIPISYDRDINTNQYEAALLPRSNSADPKDTNFIIKAKITNIRSINNLPERVYEQGIIQAKRAGNLISNELGFKNVLRTGSNISVLAEPSFDFDLTVSFQRSGGLSENSQELIPERVIALRFNREENKIERKEPWVDRVTNLAYRLTNRDISINEYVASARDLAYITTSVRSILETSIELIQCQVEELKVYKIEELGDEVLKLNQGLIAGISVGDRFILSESNFSTSQNPISSDQLETLAIAEVIRTTQYNADLRIVEGPNQDLYSVSAIPF